MRLLLIFLLFFNVCALPSQAGIKLFTTSKKSKVLKVMFTEEPADMNSSYYFTTDPNNKPTPVMPWNNYGGGGCGIWSSCWSTNPWSFPVETVQAANRTNKCGIFTLPKSKTGWIGIYRLVQTINPAPHSSYHEVLYEGPLGGLTFDQSNYVCKYPQSTNYQLITKPK